MNALFWVKRYLLAALPLFAILAAVEWYKGSATQNDYLSAALWALAAAAIFTISNYRRHRANQACAVCDDMTAALQADKNKSKKPR